MLRVDKIILAILSIEHLGFGIYGFYSPEGIAELTGYALNSEFAYSEIRAYYTLISGLGLMAFLAIFFHKLARQTYILFSFMFGCIFLGRLANYLLTGQMDNSIMIAMIAEALVIVLSLWRLASSKNRSAVEV
tara:strand:+ start:202 stop:600 length:399 start_codon:yes stop_codon:yes gene_type:complete